MMVPGADRCKPVVWERGESAFAGIRGEGPMEDQQPFEIVLAHLGGFVRVQLRGDLDFGATVRYAEALREVTDLRERVVLDVAGIRFIDSAGLRFLTHLAGAHDGPLRL